MVNHAPECNGLSLTTDDATSYNGQHVWGLWRCFRDAVVTGRCIRWWTRPEISYVKYNRLLYRYVGLGRLSYEMYDRYPSRVTPSYALGLFIQGLFLGHLEIRHKFNSHLSNLQLRVCEFQDTPVLVRIIARGLDIGQNGPFLWAAGRDKSHSH